jgi:hypothetical protein
MAVRAPSFGGPALIGAVERRPAAGSHELQHAWSRSEIPARRPGQNRVPLPLEVAIPWTHPAGPNTTRRDQHVEPALAALIQALARAAARRDHAADRELASTKDKHDEKRGDLQPLLK